MRLTAKTDDNPDARDLVKKPLMSVSSPEEPTKVCIADALSSEIIEWAKDKFNADPQQDLHNTLFQAENAEERAEKLQSWLNSELYNASRKNLLNRGVDICYLMKNLIPSFNACKTPSDFAKKMEGVNNDADVKNLFVGDKRGFPIGKIKGEPYEMKMSKLIKGSWLASATRDVDVFQLQLSAITGSASTAILRTFTDGSDLVGG